MKIKILEGQEVSASPEYEVCSHLALQHSASLVDVYNAALEAGLAYLRKRG